MTDATDVTELVRDLITATSHHWTPKHATAKVLEKHTIFWIPVPSVAADINRRLLDKMARYWRGLIPLCGSCDIN